MQDAGERKGETSGDDVLKRTAREHKRTLSSCQMIYFLWISARMPARITAWRSDHTTKTDGENSRLGAINTEKRKRAYLFPCDQM